MANKVKQRESKSQVIVLKTGVEIEVRQVGYWIVADAVARIKPPKVPKQFIEDKGREEENPAHPDYLAAMEDYQTQRTETFYRAYLYFGTSVLKAPKGMLSHEEEWWEEFEAVGIPAPQNKVERYVQWLKLVACRGDADELNRIANAVTAASGVTERDVADAADSFRGDEER